MNVRMFSYGGSGLRFLNKLMHKYITALFPESVHPYISHNLPREEFSKFDKIIFIYGDPRNAILSHIRRSKGYKWISDDEFSLTTKRFVQLSDPFQIKNVIPQQEITLTDFLTKYPDYLDFAGFFKSWLNFPFPKDYILFLKYETIIENINDLTRFVKLGSKFKQELRSVIKPRRMDYRDRPKKIVKLLNNTYSELIELQRTLPSFHVK